MIKDFPIAIFFLLRSIAQPDLTVYLTFDDGPGPGSETVYYMADSLRVNINLFIIGKYAVKTDSAAALLRQHRPDSFLFIGNHSYSHAEGHYKKYYEDPSGVLQDFQRNEDSLALTGRIARMPGRNYWRMGKRKADDIVNGGSAADSLAANGYTVFGWDIEWKEDAVHNRSAEQMLNEIRQMCRNKCTFTPGHVVMLFHDEEFRDTAFFHQVCTFITLLKKAPWRIAHLPDYPGAEIQEKISLTWKYQIQSYPGNSSPARNWQRHW